VRRIREAQLIVCQQMNCSAHSVVGQLGQLESLGHDSLARERSVAVDQQGGDLVAVALGRFGVVAVPQLHQLGASFAEDQGIDGFQMRWVGQKVDVDVLAVEVHVCRAGIVVDDVSARIAYFAFAELATTFDLNE